MTATRMVAVHTEINRLARSINEHKRAIDAMPFADCTNCEASSHMAALTGICLGCEMGACDLFAFVVTAHFGGTDG